jgi:hypothetical protein
MVAALTCGERPSYNAFAKRFRSQLVAHGTNLRGYFRRSYGSAGETHLNHFVTELANAASQRSLSDPAAYCRDAARRFAAILALEPKQLLSYVAHQPHIDSHGISPCRMSADAR